MKIDPKNKIEVFADSGALNKATAELMIKLAAEAVKARGKFTLSLSGGSTPEQLFTLLAHDDYRDRMPWKKTYIFWGDERYVALDDESNNAHVAKSLLLNKIDMPEENIFPIPVNVKPAEKAAEVYQLNLSQFFGKVLPVFDLIMLGIGANAHTASLFPHTPVLHEQKAWISAVYVEEVKMYRITMTAPLINNARNILFLAVGPGKAQVLKTIFTEPFNPDLYPAQLISPVKGKLYWFLDESAAALIK